MAAKTYSISEFRQELAKHLREKIDQHAQEIEELKRRELKKSTLLGDRHSEPGTHEAGTVGAAEHVEPGDHEQFAFDAPQDPNVGTDPVGQGMGVPAGQQGAHDICPLCGQADMPGSCTCLGIAKNEVLGYGGADSAAAPPAVADGGGDPMAMSEANPGANKEPTKQQPTPPVKGAKLPEKTKDVTSGDGSGGEPKKNSPFKKADVPMAKPPSGKVPGPGKAPMANNASKPGIIKEEDLGKSALPAGSKAQAQQHALVDASKAAAVGAPPVPAAPKLTNPADMSRAKAFEAAAAGAFQPKAPVSSGLDLASKPAPALAGFKAPPKSANPRPVVNAARPQKPGLMASIFGKSELCPFCMKSEHPGKCPEMK